MIYLIKVAYVIPLLCIMNAEKLIIVGKPFLLVLKLFQL